MAPEIFRTAAITSSNTSGDGSLAFLSLGHSTEVMCAERQLRVARVRRPGKPSELIPGRRGRVLHLN
jgi:hypothetical protein